MCNTINVYVQDHDLLSKNKIKRCGEVFVKNLTPKLLVRSGKQSIRSAYSLGAFRTPPVQTLYVEAHEPFLSSRRLNLSLNYVIKLNSCPSNPAYSCVFEPQNAKLYEISIRHSSPWPQDASAFGELWVGHRRT